MLPRFLLLLLCSLYFPPLLAQPEVEVNIEGVDGELRDNVMLMLSIAQQRNHPDLSAGRIARLHDKAPAEIRSALEPYGYYRPQIRAALSQEDEHWLAAYVIDPGPLLTITASHLRIEGAGAEEPAFQSALQDAQLSVGAPFLHSRYEELKTRLQRIADDLGYFDARWEEHQARVDLDSYGASIELVFNAGARYRFGDISIGGDIALDPALIRRYITFADDALFDTALLFDLQNALNQSDYFSVVDIKVERARAAAGRVPVSVNLGMRNRTRYAMGLGYGTDTGPRGTLKVERRYLNDQGHRLAAELKASPTHRSADLRYTIPLTQPRSDHVVTRAQYSVIDDDTTELLEVADEHVKGGWLRRYALSYQVDHFQQSISQLFIPSVAWSHISGDDPLRPDHGSRFSVDMRGSHRDQLSETSFLQTRVAGKYIIGAGAGRFITRADLGNTWTQEIDNLPPSLLFYAGGDYSVRGYAYRSIAPRNAQGETVGGKALVVGSLEYEFYLNEQWSAAVFYDAGNAYRHDPEPLRIGRGLGLRRKLPLGWLRVDAAQALSRSGDPWRLHITLGPDL